MDPDARTFAQVAVIIVGLVGSLTTIGVVAFKVLARGSRRGELEELASRYEADGGRSRPGRASLITYILVHERAKGLISG